MADEPTAIRHPRGTQTCACGHSALSHAWTPVGDWCEADDCPCDGWVW